MMLNRPGIFTDKFYEKETLIQEKKEKEEKKVHEKKEKEEKKAESIETYLKELYSNHEPVYYHQWKQDRQKDNAMVNFRGLHKNSEKTDEGYALPPSPEYKELYEQMNKVIAQIKQWCIQHNIPADTKDNFDRWDRFATNIFHPSYMNDANAAEMYSKGKEYLEKIAFELHKDNSNQAAAAQAILSLYPKLTVCAPGVATDLYLATIEFATTREEILRTARTNVANQFALEFIRKRFPPVSKGMEIHFANALCNFVADRLKIISIIDEHAAKADLTAEELESFSSLIKSETFNEQIIDWLVDYYLTKIQTLDSYTPNDLDVFLKSLDKLGSFKNDKSTNYVEDEKEPSYQLKKTEALRLALKESVMTRMVNAELIAAEHYKKIPLDEAECEMVRFAKSPTYADLKIMQKSYAYGFLLPSIDFIISSISPRQLLQKMKTPYAYVLYQNNLYCITKNPPQSLELLLLTNKEDNPDYLMHEMQLNNIKIKLGITEEKIKQIKKGETLAHPLAPEVLQFIEETCQHSLRKIYYLRKNPPDICLLSEKESALQAFASLLPSESNLVCDEKVLAKIHKLTGHSHEEIMYIDPLSLHNSWVQRRVTTEQEKDKELFTEYLKKMDEKQQLEILNHLLLAKESVVDISFLYQSAQYIKPETVRLMAESKEKELSAYTFLFALVQKNIPVLKKILIEQQDLLESKSLSDKDILTKALSSSAADVFWLVQKTIPWDLICTPQLFLKSYQAGNRNFSRVDFGEMDCSEVKIQQNEFQNQRIDFSNANLTAVKNFSTLFHHATVKLVNLEGAKISSEQFQSLYNLGLRDFSGINLSGIDLSKVKLSGKLDL